MLLKNSPLNAEDYCYRFFVANGNERDGNKAKGDDTDRYHHDDKCDDIKNDGLNDDDREE